ncbi:hypothetical protein JRQ81_010345 [Phrynocephalus forsythii]|uniref:LRAT domain-containing protein n=1 Tax=Phrynocephalus forsythii TaxID=171643 RepID=A0A9Q0XBN9_9SAUR|nr:hypothetical protein JRQ81_010345 [Phrynocephalus forsythii]
MGQASSLSMLQEPPKPGDLIEFLGPRYKHYGIAIDEESLVHLTCLDVGDRCHHSPSLHGKKLVVKFESIAAVARNGQYRINNKHDKIYQARPPKQIVRAALDRLGEEVTYHRRRNNCEHFATRLRYGIALGEQEEQVPEPGDLVEFPRHLYNHYGVAVDNEHVVHLTSANPGNSASAAGPKAVVQIDRLSDVAWNHNYRVSKKYDQKRMPRDPDEILQDAKAKVGQKVNYNLLNWNCEHFATGLRYGNPESKQFSSLQQV